MNLHILRLIEIDVYHRVIAYVNFGCVYYAIIIKKIINKKFKNPEPRY